MVDCDPRSNRVLSSLPAADQTRLLLQCRPVSLGAATVLYDMGDAVRQVHLPLSGVVSLVSGVANGSTVEVASVASEGLVDPLVALGEERAPWRAVVQIEGDFLRAGMREFRTELARSAALVGLCEHLVTDLAIQISRSAACNSLHPVEQRLCRWLLKANDRAESDEMHLTQQFMAEMLGVRRPTVSAAVALLEKAGLVECSRGKIVLRSREGLENAACECYSLIDRPLARAHRQRLARSARAANATQA